MPYQGDKEIEKVRYTTVEVSRMTGISIPMVYFFWKQIRGEEYKAGTYGRLTLKQIEKIRELAGSDEEAPV